MTKAKNPPATTNTNKAEDDFQKVDLKRFFQISYWVFKFVYKLSPKYTIVYALSQTGIKMFDVINSLILAKLTDILVSATQSQNFPVRDIYYVLGMIFGFSIVMRIMMMFERWSITGLRIYQRPLINRKFAAKVSSLGIQALERSEINNQIFRADSSLMLMISYLESTLDIVAQIIKLGTLTAILLGFVPEFVPLIALSMIPMYLLDKNFRVHIYKFFRINTEKHRMAAASLNDITNTRTLPEVTLIQAVDFLDKKYWEFQKWYTEKWGQINITWQSRISLAMTLSDLVILAALFRVIANAFKQTISVGDTIFQYRSLTQFQGGIRGIFSYVNDLMEQAIKMADVYDVFHMESGFKDGDTPLKKLDKGPKIILDNVSFKYSNADRYVIKDLNLIIDSGEKIAIVGANGAGKTTLIKLICRFYELNAGKILINNENIENIKMSDLHKNIGILFQDYNNYPQLTVRENILIGNATEPVDEIAVRLAADQADASEFINNFPDKYDQLLNEKYKKGIRPSTGQWQKLAIARFFYRNAPLVIFDEPTASIDAVSEYNIFNRIYEFFTNKTVIIISHRFSTVRNADRIIVLDKGEIVEQGSHEELMNQKGKYAEAFLLQAKGYVEKLY